MNEIAQLDPIAQVAAMLVIPISIAWILTTLFKAI